MRRERNAKITATLGPSSSKPEQIKALFLAGADVFRLNFSHGSHAGHRLRHEAIRALEREVGRPIGILMDLQGPKLRIGTFADGPVELMPGTRFRLDLDRWCIIWAGSRPRMTVPARTLTPGLPLWMAAASMSSL